MIIFINEEQEKVLTKGWKIKNGELYKKFQFESYDDVMDFVNKIAKISKKQNHHPKLVVEYNSVEVFMFDHEEDNISDKCYKFVKAVNSI